MKLVLCRFCSLFPPDFTIFNLQEKEGIRCNPFETGRTDDTLIKWHCSNSTVDVKTDLITTKKQDYNAEIEKNFRQ